MQDVLELIIDARLAKRGGDEWVRTIDRVDKSSSRADKALQRVQRAANAVGLVLSTGLIGRAVFSTIAAFQQAMSEVSAVTGAVGRGFDRLTEKAKELGATTRFSASQAAEGMAFLGRAGFDTSQILLSIGPALALAAAGALDLGSAADIASNVLSGFSLGAEKMGVVVDVLAATAASANTSVLQLGEGMKFAAPVAASLDVAIEEVAVSMGLLGNAGLQATLAGTGLRRIMSELASPSAKAKETFKEMELTLNDVSLQSHSLTGVIENLAGAGLTAAQAFDIFGDRGAPAILALTSQVGDIDRMRQVMLTSEGAAERMAATMENNLAGATRELRSAVEGLILETGDRGLAGALRSAVDNLTDVVRAMSGSTDATRRAQTIVSGLKLAVAALIALKLVAWLQAGTAALVAFATAAGSATLALGPLAAAITAVGLGLNELLKAWGRANDEFIEGATSTNVAADAMQRLQDAFDRGFITTDDIEAATDAIENLLAQNEKLIDQREALLNRTAGTETPAVIELNERIKANDLLIGRIDFLLSRSEELKRVNSEVADSHEAAAAEAREHASALAEIPRKVGQLRTVTAEVANRLSEAPQRVTESFRRMVGDVKPMLQTISTEAEFTARNIETAFSRMTKNIKAGWREMVDAMAHAAANALLGIIDGTMEVSQAIEELSAQAGAMVGASTGIPGGEALGGFFGRLLGRAVGSLFEGSRGFGQANIQAGPGGLTGGDILANKNADLDALDRTVRQMLDTVNALFDELGLSIADLGATFDIIVQDGRGVVVNVDGLQHEFASMEEAIGFLATTIAQTATFAGLSAEAAAAVRQAGAEAGNDLEAFAADVSDIQAIVEAMSPKLPDAALRIKEGAQEAARLVEQAERFGLDASGVIERFGLEVADAAAALLSSAPPLGQGVEAIRTWGQQLRETALAINQVLRSFGFDEFLIDVSQIDARQRAAVNQERRRQAEEAAREIAAAEELIAKAMESFTGVFKQVDPFEEQLDRLREIFEEAEQAALAQGLATDDLRQAYLNAVLAVIRAREEAEALALEEERLAAIREQQRLNSERASFRGDVLNFAAGVFEQVGDAERAARLRANAEKLNRQLALIELRMRLNTLKAEGAITEQFFATYSNLLDDVEEALDLIGEVTDDLDDLAGRLATERSFSRDLFGFAADVFEATGDAEAAASLRAQAEHLNRQLTLAELQLRLQTLHAEQAVSDAFFAEMTDLLNELGAAVDGLDPDKLPGAADDAARILVRGAERAANALGGRVGAAGRILEDLLRGRQGSGSTGNPIADILAEFDRIRDELRPPAPAAAAIFNRQLAELLRRLGHDLAASQVQAFIDDLVARERLEALTEAIAGLLEPLREFRDSLILSARAPIDLHSQFLFAREQFEDLQRRFREGDLTVATDIPDAAQALLDAAASVIPQGSIAFQSIFDSIQAFLDEALATDPSTLAEQVVQQTSDEGVLSAVREAAASRDRLLEQILEEQRGLREDLRTGGALREVA